MSGVFLESGVLEFRGERTRVTGLVREAIDHLLNPPSPPQLRPDCMEYAGYQLLLNRLCLIELETGQVACVLTRCQATVLYSLIKCPTGASHEVIFNDLYDLKVSPPHDHIIRVFIYHLRRHFRRASIPWVIKPVWGVGYQLVTSAS